MKVFTALLAALWFPFSALAHHSTNHFDIERRVTLTGTVEEFQYRNPHVYFRVRGTLMGDESDEEQVWEVEGQGIPLLAPRGLRRDSAKPGDTVTLIANPHRDSGRRLMNGLMVTLADGDHIALHSVTPSDIAELTNLDSAVDRVATDISGVWLPRNLGYLQLFQRDDWKLTERAAEMQASFDGTQIPQADCSAVPPPRLTLWPVIHMIEIADDVVMIRSDWMGAERIVHIGGSHPEVAELSILGHAIGRWEDGTLVVDTTHFAEAAAGITLGIGSSERKHLVERLTLDEDRNQLLYEFMLEDPEFLAEPLTGSAYLTYRPDLEPSGVVCDPEVSSRFLSEL